MSKKGISVQVGPAHPPATPSEAEPTGATRALQDGRVDTTAQRRQTRGKGRGNLLPSMYDNTSEANPGEKTALLCSDPKTAPGAGVGNASRNSCKKTTKILDWAPAPPPKKNAMTTSPCLKSQASGEYICHPNLVLLCS